MHINMRGFAINMECMVMTIISQSCNNLLCSLLISSSGFMKLTMGISVIGGNLLRTKSYFVFVRLVSLKSDIDLNINNELDKFNKG